ncbi:Tyrosine-protein kinase PR2 [Hypsibius exemplaris]|uniref:non-specific protein-tyrosine kinase n=1 Tax=Hypsibius exemplaris TaxID=2072580 RepID=A0A1W0WHT5_HYPEX|nr:Tyrosine-protein kinase PR2 [Hypsibius exemplaris]
MASCSLTLQEFLAEAELQHYYNALWNDLKVTGVSQLKYVEEDDLIKIGMSRPEQRRLKKFFNKHCPQTYLGKFVKIIHTKTSSSASSAASQTGSSRRNSGVEQWEVRRDLPGGGGGGKHAAPSRQAGNTTKHIIPISSIKLGPLLGTGQFGSVHQAVLTEENGHLTQVAVKCLENDRLHCSPAECLKEAALLHSLEHERIVRFFGGALTQEPEPSVWLVSELAPHRSLLECLRDPLLKTNLTVMALCDIAVQICDAMKYLEARDIVHGDLSARNVLVFSRLKVKVGDVGLSRVLDGGNHTHEAARRAAWFPPEYIRTGRFNCLSDVWSFGVTLWEIFSFGLEPWAGCTVAEIMGHVEASPAGRLDQPDLCPKDYYKIMWDCWSLLEGERPTFAKLFEILPDKKPEQLQAIRECLGSSAHARNALQYAIGDVIFVLDNSPDDGSHFWKGVGKSRKPGLFDPSDTVTYLGSADMLPTSGEQQGSSKVFDARNAFPRRSKIRRDMISRPQADFRHTGHVGMDGAYFGDISFLDKGFGPVHSLARSYDKAEDERSMGYGGSRDTTPLISSRLSIPRTIGSESRMSSESWQNTTGSSESPRSDSSRSSGNAKENHHPSSSPPSAAQRKAASSISASQPAAMLPSWRVNGHGGGGGSRYGDQEYGGDRSDGAVNNKASLPIGGGERRIIQSLRTPDDKSFDLDFGPSLMEEVFGVINGNCGNSDTLSSISDFKDSPLPPIRGLEPHLPPKTNGSVSSSELPSNSPPKFLRPIAVVQSPASVAAPQTVQAVPVTTALPPKPAPPTKPPKPLALARKKLDPISVVREESIPHSTLKPTSPRDDKVIEDFIDTSAEVVARSAGIIHSSLSPAASQSKSRFSFRGFRSKPSETIVAPERPKIFLAVDQPAKQRCLEDQVSDEAKEAYRVLVEEGQIKIHCPPPTPTPISEEEEEDSSSSPLKLLRNGGVGMVPKQRGNRGGLAGSTFNRSLSHELPRGLGGPPVNGVAVVPSQVPMASQSFRLPSRPSEMHPITESSLIISPPIPDVNGTKKVERPNVAPPPPPLPPRDRSKPSLVQSTKPRERKYPLLMPGGGDEAGAQHAAAAAEIYQNPEMDGLVVEKSASVAFRKLSNGHGPPGGGSDLLRNHSTVIMDQSGREVSF